MASGFESKRMDYFNPDVYIAILLHPCAPLGVEHVPLILRGANSWQRDYCAHGQRRVRISCGHRSISKPWVLNSAMTMRSNPKPRHAVLAT